MKKQLLIVFHSQSGRNQQVALTCWAAARANSDVTVRLLRAIDASSDDVMQSDLLLLITPEMNGMISGGMKEFLDRVFYPLERAKKQALPYALIIACGNAGTATQMQLDKILSGIFAKKVQDGLIIHGEPSQTALDEAEALAKGLAEGLALGVF